ncbi:MAG: hypothetical protein J6Q02_03290 [Lachnospiraceae bacterium]|nr:hypothetical protein [Lachnospiraceae bacterium]MBO7340331.1 hypothetical protein [Lachnospiraceae bacterium]
MDYFMVLDAFPGLRNVNFGVLLLIPVIAIVIVIITIGFIAKEISEVKRSGYHYDTTGGGEESPDANAQILANGGWTCPLCGNVLSDKVIQCRCGGRKGDAPKQPKDEEEHA